VRQTVRLGRIRGIPVGVHWSVLVSMVLLAQVLATSTLPSAVSDQPWPAYWAVAVTVAAAFLLALLAHEVGHALVARGNGVGVRRITLWVLGGVTEMDGEPPHARADLLIALAGPVTSALFAAGFWLAAAIADAAGAPPLAVVSLSWLAVVNGILAAFNLLPGAPLDGGRVLRAALWRVRGDRVAARRVAIRAGVVLGIVLASLGLTEMWFGYLGGLWLVALGWFLTVAARAEGAVAELGTLLVHVRVEDAMTSPAVCGYAGETVDGFLARVARHYPHRCFLVLDLDGRPTGLVTLAGLARVPEPHRAAVRLAEAQVPLARLPMLAPSTPLSVVAAELSTGIRLAPVVSDGRVVGVLTAADLTRTRELVALGVAPRRTEETIAG
jgi:Zn-dependent protease